MNPSAFTFKISVPNDPDSVTLIGEVAQHAAAYAGLEGDAAEAFAERTRAAAAKALNGGGQSCLAVVAAANGNLTITIGSESVSQPLS